MSETPAKQRSCFWGHDWTKWTDPEPVKLYGGGFHLVQARKCRRCNKAEKEMVL